MIDTITRIGTGQIFDDRRIQFNGRIQYGQNCRGTTKVMNKAIEITLVEEILEAM